MFSLKYKSISNLVSAVAVVGCQTHFYFRRYSDVTLNRTFCCEEFSNFKFTK
jgi:hypothetical protein